MFFILIRFSGCGREIPVKYPWLDLTVGAVVPSTGGQTGMGGQQEILCGGTLSRHAPGCNDVVLGGDPLPWWAAVLWFLIKPGIPVGFFFTHMLTGLDNLHEISVNEMQTWLQLSHSSWVERFSSTGDGTLFSVESCSNTGC